MNKDVVIFAQNQISTYLIDRHTINQSATEKRDGHCKCHQKNIKLLRQGEIFEINNKLELCYID